MNKIKRNVIEPAIPVDRGFIHEVAESRPDPAGPAHRERGDVSCLQIEVGLRLKDGGGDFFAQ